MKSIARKRWPLLVAVLAAGLILALVIMQFQSVTGAADPADRRQVNLGAKVYAQYCTACHGARLEGQPNWRERKPNGRLPAPPHDETGHTWHHPDQHLFRVTKYGVKPPLAPEGYQSDMPGFSSLLTDEEIWAVLAYIKSQWPEHIRARQSSTTERFKQ